MYVCIIYNDYLIDVQYMRLGTRQLPEVWIPQKTSAVRLCQPNFHRSAEDLLGLPADHISAEHRLHMLAVRFLYLPLKEFYHFVYIWRKCFSHMTEVSYRLFVVNFYIWGCYRYVRDQSTQVFNRFQISSPTISKLFYIVGDRKNGKNFLAEFG